jgi:hypothetical protein
MNVGHELRGDDDAVALLPVMREVLADDRLGVTLRVPVRGVEEVAAAIDVGIEDALRLRGLGAPAPFLAERHRAEAERADAQARVSHRDVVVERHGPDGTLGARDAHRR